MASKRGDFIAGTAIGNSPFLKGECPVRELYASNLGEMRHLMEEVERWGKEGNFAVFGIPYSLGHLFDEALPQRESGEKAFAFFYKESSVKNLSYLPEPEADFEVLNFSPEISQAEYLKNFHEVKRNIQAGNVYQINYCFPLTGWLRGSPLSFFSGSLKYQPVQYSFYIDLGDKVIASFSPELFFSKKGEEIVSKPMKGTAPRQRDDNEDRAVKIQLSLDAKSQAENIMIVDMVRNDLSRVALKGSVKIRSLFEVEEYETLYQMTTTVEGKTTAALYEILKAVFPPASITGAPKVRACEVIKEVEREDRGWYTGCLGFYSKELGIQTNVAIRTAVIEKDTSRLTYWAGSGVVYDSNGEKEWEECLNKSRTVTHFARDFSLFETIKYSPVEGYYLIERHIDRLKNSAAFFNFSFEKEKIKEYLNSLNLNEKCAVKIILSRDGKIDHELRKLPERNSGLKLKLARTPVLSGDILLHHKTTAREVFSDKLRESGEKDDVVLWNERGEVTESTIGNLAFFINGKWITPQLKAGCLPGTERGRLIEEGRIKEGTILVGELFESVKMARFNSIRGWEEGEIILPQEKTLKEAFPI